MQVLSLRDCLGLDKVDRLYYATQPPYSPNVVNQTVDYGGAVWKGNPGSGWTMQSDNSGGSSGGGGQIDPVETAKKIVQFMQQSNQPAIATLQGQIDPLQQRYTDLLNSIKGQQTTSENYTTQATTSELGRRGLLPQSEEGQRTLGQALQPLTAQFQGLSAQTGLAENQDIMNIQNAIASLQAGNPEGAIGVASQLSGQQSQLEASRALANAQVQAAQALPYTPLSAGQTLGNRLNGIISLPNFGR